MTGLLHSFLKKMSAKPPILNNHKWPGAHFPKHAGALYGECGAQPTPEAITHELLKTSTTFRHAAGVLLCASTLSRRLFKTRVPQSQDLLIFTSATSRVPLSHSARQWGARLGGQLGATAFPTGAPAASPTGDCAPSAPMAPDRKGQTGS